MHLNLLNSNELKFVMDKFKMKSKWERNLVSLGYYNYPWVKEQIQLSFSTIREDAVPTVLVTVGGYFVFSQNNRIWFDPTTGVVANLTQWA